MIMNNRNSAWVVYWMTIHKRNDRPAAVCNQDEWDAMELARPGYHTLMQEGIATEMEAEALARRHPFAEPTAVT